MASRSGLIPVLVLLATLAPALHADVKSGTNAIARKDYNTAWRELMPLALQGNSEAEALMLRNARRGGCMEQKWSHQKRATHL